MIRSIVKYVVANPICPYQTLYDQAMYRYDEATRGKLPTDDMTFDAILAFVRQGKSPDQTVKADYNAIVNPKNKQFGCAWSTKCGTVHYLYCSFYHG